MIGCLLSYHYHRDVEDATPWLLKHFGPDPPPLFLDSGAFSAYTKGEPITLAEYADWVKANGHHFDHYISLDVIYDAGATRRNQARLEKLGLEPVPVYHVGEPLRVFDKLCERYPYIAVGGIIISPTKGPKLWRWLDELFERKPPGVELHGFGVSSWRVIEGWPWASVDSSSWSAGFRYGEVTVWDPFRHRWRRISTRTRGQGAWREMMDVCREYGCAPWRQKDLRKKYHGRAMLVRLLGASWEAALQSLDRPGFRMYLCDSNLWHLAVAIDGCRQYTRGLPLTADPEPVLR